MATFDPSIYLGNPNLPSSKAQFEYTPEMIKEIKKCEKDLLYFAEHHFYIVTENGKEIIGLHRPQKRVLKSFVKHKRVVVLSPRQVGKTTMVTVYALWFSMFNSDKTILVVANKESTAIELLRRIRMAYELVPNWLKPGIKEWGKTAVVFSNDSRIIISSTSSTAARGTSANCLSGETMVTIKDTETDSIFDISMESLSALLEADGNEIKINLIED